MIADKNIYRDDDNQFWRVTHSLSDGYFIVAECDQNGIIPADPYREEVALWEIQNFDIVGKDK